MPTALLSVYDKTGLIDFARALHALSWTLLASGNTAKSLRENNLPVTEVADYTKSPEILGGRVKTLHPAIHGGLLARATENDRNELLNFGWDYIDLVAVNLYPFEQTITQPNATFDDAIEQIDIGGVTLIRAAAKNHQRVTLVCDPNDYAKVLSAIKNGGVSSEIRKQFAVKGFQMTTQYDSAISNYLAESKPTANPSKEGNFSVDTSTEEHKKSPLFGGDLGLGPVDTTMQLQLHHIQTLRYGENPHQSATLYNYQPNTGPLGGKLLQGKELSYNNLLDLDAAWKVVLSYEKPTICIVKHLSPCGIASHNELSQAYQLALASDPISAFGGIIASNYEFDAATANALDKLFVECIVAPKFSDAAKKILSTRTQCRLLEIPDLKLNPSFELRSINNGVLKQDLDLGNPNNMQWEVVSERKPTDAELTALKFAWRACQHVRSNAIVLAQAEATVGIGGGQPNRVDCVRIAAERAGEKAKGSAMASDAFFPFSDSIELAAQFGITAVIQPGGSKRDAESIAAANKAGMAMVVTGVRHFRH